MKTIDEEIRILKGSISASKGNEYHELGLVDEIILFFTSPKTLSANDCMKLLGFQRELTKNEWLAFALSRPSVFRALHGTVEASCSLFDRDADKFEVEREYNIVKMGKEAEGFIIAYPNMCKAEPYTSLSAVKSDIKFIRELSDDDFERQSMLTIWFNLRVKPMRPLFSGMTNEKLSFFIDVISIALGSGSLGGMENVGVKSEWLDMRPDLIQSFPFLGSPGEPKNSEEKGLLIKYAEGELYRGEYDR